MRHWKKLLALTVLVMLSIIGSVGYSLYKYTKTSEFKSTMVDAGLGNSIMIPLSGTGSMYPTFPKGKGKTHKELAQETVGAADMYYYPTGFLFFDNKYYEYSVQRGDIISFANAKTKEVTKADDGEEHSFVKRVIGLPGDSIELRDGILYLNGTAQKEPYTALPRSTFGNDLVHDCAVYKVPSNKYFVMGDNRKASYDSRSDLGVIDQNDIEFVLPLYKQKGKYDLKWRNTAHDLDEEGRIHLDVADFIKRLNEERTAQKLSSLTFNLKLSDSASRRGTSMLKNNDFSFEASRSGYTMKQSMKDAGYSNIVWGEIPVLGYYESQELYENFIESPKVKKFLEDKDYDDVGIAEVNGELNSCPAHIIVLQFGGYVPPNYSKEEISSWEKVLSNLQEVYPNWSNLKTIDWFYAKHKADIDRLLSIFDTRISNIKGIIARMKSNEWLTESQLAYIKRDEALYSESQALSVKLNDYASSGD